MERLDIIETLRDLPLAIEEEIAGLPESALRHRPSEDAWSIKEVIGHLRDHVEIWQKRFFMVWSLQDPVLPSYNPEQQVRDRNYQDADLKAVLADLRERRLDSVRLLSRAVDWTRLGQMPREGRRSLKQLAESAIAHEASHLEQIRALKAAQGAAAGAR